MTDVSRGRTKARLIACISAALALLLAYGAYRIVSWLGVGVFGLFMAFVAVQADMDDTAPIGGAQNTGLYSSSLRGQDRMLHGEKAARRADNTATLKILNLFKAVGAVLAAVGLIGFFWLQLPK